MALIKVGGVELPTPSDYQVGIEDIVKAERNARGDMIKEIITTKRKIELAWKYLGKDELSQVLRAVKPNFFTVEYVDPEDNGLKTGTFYSGPKTAPALDYRNGEMRWKDIKFNLIERWVRQ